MGKKLIFLVILATQLTGCFCASIRSNPVMALPTANGIHRMAGIIGDLVRRSANHQDMRENHMDAAVE
jgi:hypothetical protein